MKDRTDTRTASWSVIGRGPRTLIDLLCEQARCNPDRLLYTFLSESEQEAGSLTCAELDRQARAIGAMLQQSNATGERALLLYPPGLEFVAAFFGCLYAGVIAIPAPAPNPARLKRTLPRLQAIAADAQVSLGLTVSNGLSMIEEIASQAEDLGALRWVATDGLEDERGRAWRNFGVRAEDLAYLQYTSGSTASPKGVMVSHANVLHNSEYIRQAWGYGPESTSVVWIPYYHDDGLVHGITQPLYTGYRAVLMSPLSFVQQPIRWLRAISRYRATHSGGPNFAYELATRKASAEQRAELDLSSWRVAYNAAEPVRQETIFRFAEAFEPCGFRREAFYPAYGLAEATLLVSTRSQAEAPVFCRVRIDALERENRVIQADEAEPQARSLVGCGQAVGHTRIAIVEPGSLIECAPCEVGEIWVRDASVAQGYWDRPEETTRTFKASLADTGEGPFLRTGDLGFLMGGELFVTGRLKDLIIIRGQNHYPQDIEWTAEQSHPSLRPGCSAAFSLDVADQERLALAIETDHRIHPASSQPDAGPAGKDRLDGDYKELIGMIRQAVAEHHDLQLYAVALLEPGSIPKTSSGKIQRHACRNDFLEKRLSVVAEWVQDLEATAPSVATANPNHHSKTTRSAESIQSWIVFQIANRLGIQAEDIDVRAPLARYGLDSREAVSLAGDLEIWLGCKLAPTIIYEHPTIEALVRHLSGGAASPSSPVALPAAQPTQCEPIAIIGIGCRFPGARGPEAFWRLLRDGVDAISEVPTDRWGLDSFYDPDPAAPGKVNTRWGGFLDQVDRFDRDFFGISLREAMRMDPQQRLLLEVAWEAIADAGQAPDKLDGTQTGVFVGISTSEYGWLQLSDIEHLDAYWGTGTSPSIAANRLSYIFNFRGPSIAVDTACSSSLAAVHLACRSLSSGESTLALAGGVSLILSPAYTINFTKAGVMAPDGRCKAFDARANGYVRGEGAGLVVLKPLSQALADNDPIYAVILGSAINNDGRTNGLMAPSRQSQEALLWEAYRRAGVSPGQVQYVETHGTGTSLGDPMEARALGSVLSFNRPAGNHCAIGSVKTNIGHLEAAAGIGGLIKVALALKHQAIPPSLHFETPNPHIPFDELPLRVQQTFAPWPAVEGPALAGVSSFGFGGSNAHMVLQAPPRMPEAARAEETGASRPHLLPLSAHNRAALQELARSYIDLLGESEGATTRLVDICYTASLRQKHQDYRLAVAGRTRKELIERLEEVVRGDGVAKVSSCRGFSTEQRKPVFVFSGQGSQWAGMGRDLLEQEPAFREALERCDSAFRRQVDWSLLEALTAGEAASQLDRIDILQPAIFAIQVALAALWRAWGVEPSAIVGQSMGEIAAAHVAGALSLDDAAWTVCHRGRLLKQVIGKGRMAAVELSLEESERLLAGYEDRLSIAVSNGPASTVLSGETAALEEIVRQLQHRDIFCRLLNVDFASHSPQMDPLRDELVQSLKRLEPRAASVPIYSTVTGAVDGNRFDATYWWRNLREPVLFFGAVEDLLKRGHDLFLEISPHPILLSAIQQVAYHAGREVTLLASLQRDEQGPAVMLRSLGTLYTQGYPVAWGALYPDRGRCVRLPSYPWQRERCWFSLPRQENKTSPNQSEHGLNAQESYTHLDRALPSSQPAWPDIQIEESPSQINAGAADPVLYSSKPLQAVAPAGMEDWLYTIEWQLQPHPQQSRSLTWPSQEDPGNWLIFNDDCGVGSALCSVLEDRGGTCVLVSPGEQYQILGQGHFQVNPGRPEDFRQLLEDALKPDLSRWRGIVHLWGLEAASPADIAVADLEAAQIPGCVSLLHLVQALHREREGRHEYISPHSGGPRLYLVTCRTQAVKTKTRPLSIAQSPLWGLARTIHKEHPEFGCKSVDMSAVDAPEEIQSLLQEVLPGDSEDQVALRGDARFVPRLVRYRPRNTQQIQQAPFEMEGSFIASADHAFRLHLSKPGTLDSLTLRAVPHSEPGPGEIKIGVQAAGLNFVDLLRALGVIAWPPGDDLLLGGECAGTVTAVGEGVTSFRVGDDVIAVAPGCFGSYAIADTAMTVHRPEHLSPQEAATIPVAFLTAYYALVHLGRLKAKERVLIHAASGGVGLAAVQIARRIGAEILATAGSEKKREFLRALGIEQVMDSRSLTFADEVMEQTSGEGVDVVLNSLPGEAIAKGLSTLRAYGRFLEIGKRDIARDAHLGLSPFQRNLSFFAIDLDRMCRERPSFVGDLLNEVMGQVREGSLKPLPLQVFPVSAAASAFRAMAQADHIGKILVSVPDGGEATVSASSDEASLFRPDATYAISGGTGGLGLTIAGWMARQGARHLVLISRRGAFAAEAEVDEVRRACDQLLVARADVAEPRDVSRVLKEIGQTMPPLRGIIHAAGILDDGMIRELSQSRFESVMASKLSGAWNLHIQTLNTPLDFFVLFSSAASLLGSPGQANYAAANAFLDALTHYRRASGLPAMTINWGPWAEVGLAAQPDRGARLGLRGVSSITPQQGVEALGHLLKQDAAQVGVLPVDWKQWQQSFNGTGGSRLLDRLLSDSGRGPTEAGRPGLRQSLTAQRLRTARAGERERLMRIYLCEKVAVALGLASFSVEVDWPLTKQGLDSLLAVELKHRIESDLGVSVPVAKLLQGVDIDQLATFILSQVMLTDAPLATRHDLRPPRIEGPVDNRTDNFDGENAEELSARLGRLPEAELDSLLSNLLAQDEAG